jgi:transposase-like protein
MPRIKRITIKEKIALLATLLSRKIRTSSDSNQSTIKALAREYGVFPSLLCKWEKQLDILIQHHSISNCN